MRLARLTLTQVKVSEKERNKETEIGEKKVTMTQGGTPTRDLANGLPCSNRVRELRGRAARDPAEVDTKLACLMGRLFGVHGNYLCFAKGGGGGGS